MIKEIQVRNPDFSPMRAADRFLVISLGTGSPKNKPHYDAAEAARWGIFQWIYPLLDIFTEASNDMADIQLSTLFQGLFSQEHYLRIQVYIYIELAILNFLGWITYFNMITEQTIYLPTWIMYTCYSTRVTRYNA